MRINNYYLIQNKFVKSITMNYFSSHFKLGILGGGQLGKMLAIEAANWHLPIYIMDQDQQFPAVPYAPFFQAGDFKNFDDVVQFGKKVDILTIEIEQIIVNKSKSNQLV